MRWILLCGTYLHNNLYPGHVLNGCPLFSRLISAYRLTNLFLLKASFKFSHSIDAFLQHTLSMLVALFNALFELCLQHLL